VLTISLSREPAGTLRLEQLTRGENHLVIDLHELTLCDSRGIATSWPPPGTVRTPAVRSD
jgi:hypothetical protein